MAISIDWGQKIINVPKVDLLLVQAGPPQEIRQLDLDGFRLSLKDLEDSEEGIWALDTHNHNPPVTVGGVTLARVIEIINGYTVTFEDGQYAVNLVGANSNVADVTNVNQVSVRSANSAGLTFSEQINDQSFINGFVYVDSSRGRPGTSFPRGTLTDPVDNLSDALIIATGRRLHAFKIYGEFVLSNAYEGWVFQGADPSHDSLNLNGQSVDSCTFNSVGISGSFSGIPNFNKCHLREVTSMAGTCSECFFFTSLTIRTAVGFSPVLVSMSDCKSAGAVVVYVGGSQKILVGSGLTGRWTVRGATTGMIPSIVQFGFYSGSLILESDCTGGECTIDGIVDVTDNSNMTVFRKAQIQSSPGAYDGYVHVDTVNGQAGVLYPIGTASYPVNNLEDALDISDSIHVKSLKVKGTIVIDQPLLGYTLDGSGSILDDILVLTGMNVAGSLFKSCTVTGVQVGEVNFDSCIIQDVSGFSGVTSNCSFGGTITLGGFGSYLLGLNATAGDLCTIDMAGPGRIFKATFSGALLFKNCQEGVPFPTSVGVVINYGIAQFDSSCTGGMLSVLGDCSVINNGSAVVLDGSLDGRHGTDSWESASASDIADAVWDKTTSGHASSGTFGELLQLVSRLTGNKVTKVGSIITIYTEDNSTPWRQYDLFGGGRVRL